MDRKFSALQPMSKRTINRAVQSFGTEDSVRKSEAEWDRTIRELLEHAERLFNSERIYESVPEEEGGEALTPKGFIASKAALTATILMRAHEIVALSYNDDPVLLQRIGRVLGQVATTLLSNHHKSVLWHPNIWEAAVAGDAAFVGKPWTREDAPHTDLKPTLWWHAAPRRFDEEPFDSPSSWWTPDWECHALYIYPSDRLIPTMDRHGMKQTEDATGVFSFWWNSGHGEKSLDPSDRLPRIVFEPGLIFGQPAAGVFATLMAAEAFLRLPIVRCETADSLNHQERKFYKRNNSEPPEVQTILLRKTKSSPEKADADGEHRNFGCHFLVGAHWRKPKSNSKTGNPEYVRPYIKGNLEKPFKTGGTRIYVASR